MDLSMGYGGDCRRHPKSRSARTLVFGVGLCCLLTLPGCGDDPGQGAEAASGGAPFREEVIDPEGPNAPWGKAVGDINGDGLIDIVIGGHRPRYLTLFERGCASWGSSRARTGSGSWCGTRIPAGNGTLSASTSVFGRKWKWRTSTPTAAMTLLRSPIRGWSGWKMATGPRTWWTPPSSMMSKWRTWMATGSRSWWCGTSLCLVTPTAISCGYSNAMATEPGSPGICRFPTAKAWWWWT